MPLLFWVLMGAGVLVWAGLVYLRADANREIRQLDDQLEELDRLRAAVRAMAAMSAANHALLARRLRSQAVFQRRVAEIEAREAELEDGCQGGHPAPRPVGLQLVGPTDAAIAEELIRQTAPHRGSRA